MMIFTPFISTVEVTESVELFFCEFTLSEDLFSANYLATYTHKLTCLPGISSETEANFYAYQVCIHSQIKGIRFNGYFPILNHILGNARRLLSEKEHADVINRTRPEIIKLAKKNQEYWVARYSPSIGDAQGQIYDLYLEENKIESGRKNYSKVAGLLILH